MLAIVGREVPGIELGTGVVPTYPRHPMMLAQQALTVQAATGGRLALGIGLSHQIVIENMFGLSFDKPLRHMREYLSILVPLIQTGSVSFTGETLSTSASINVPGSSPCPVLVAALGPKMLELAGTVADGTVTWMTGPDTLGSLHGPDDHEGGRRPPGGRARAIGAAMPVCVTDDVDATKARAAKVYADVRDAAVVPGDARPRRRRRARGPGDHRRRGRGALRDRGGIEDAGVTDFVAAEFGSGAAEKERTRDLLRSLL